MEQNVNTIEFEKIHAEIAKLMAETSRINEESRKVAAETVKLQRETFWYPMAITSGLAGAVAAIITLIVKAL